MSDTEDETKGDKEEKETAAADDDDDDAETSSSNRTTSLLHGVDIAQLLSSSGPVVQCVLLRCMRADGKDAKPHPASSKIDETHHRLVLTELIDQVEVDTTPSKSGVKKVFGNRDWTFLGQYPSEGTVVMAVKQQIPDDDDLATLSIAQLRNHCRACQIDTSQMIEKGELVTALLESAISLPINPHRLQPPLDKLVVRGDILLMKVAETKEELDNEDNDEENDKEGEETKIQVPTNEEFFLDYTKDEYVAFASRSDVVADYPESDDVDDSEGEEEDGEDEDDDDDDDEADEDYAFGPEDEEEENKALLNLLLAEVIRKFREDNSRGPTSAELLDLRRQVAEQLGVEVPTVESLEEEKKKRAATNGDDGEQQHTPSSKKVKFGPVEELTVEPGETGSTVVEQGNKEPTAAEDDQQGDSKVATVDDSLGADEQVAR